MTKFRYYFILLGAHVHVKMFAGDGGKVGNMVFREHEWADFMEQTTGEFIPTIRENWDASFGEEQAKLRKENQWIEGAILKITAD